MACSWLPGLQLYPSVEDNFQWKTILACCLVSFAAFFLALFPYEYQYSLLFFSSLNITYFLYIPLTPKEFPYIHNFCYVSICECLSEFPTKLKIEMCKLRSFHCVPYHFSRANIFNIQVYFVLCHLEKYLIFSLIFHQKFLLL